MKWKIGLFLVWTSREKMARPAKRIHRHCRVEDCTTRTQRRATLCPKHRRIIKSQNGRRHRPISPPQLKPLQLVLNPLVVNDNTKDRLSPVSASKKVTQLLPIHTNGVTTATALPSPTRDVYAERKRTSSTSTCSRHRNWWNPEELNYWILQDSEQDSAVFEPRDISIPNTTPLIEGQAIRDLYRTQMQKSC